METVTEKFTRNNTNFFAINPRTGVVAVYSIYTQGPSRILLRMADAVEVKPGVFQRRNHSAGFDRFPRSYDSAHAALAGMVKKKFQNTIFALPGREDLGNAA